MNGNRLASEIDAEAGEPRDRDAVRAAIATELPDWRPASASASAAAPSVERAREDAALDEAIEALPAVDRSRLSARALKLARRQWPGAWPGDRDPSVRQAVARIRRDLFAAQTQPQDS